MSHVAHKILHSEHTGPVRDAVQSLCVCVKMLFTILNKREVDAEGKETDAVKSL